jgi:DNA-directed RNA polymerase specialized sigma24 family protein
MDLRRRVRHADVAEDLTQDTRVRLMSYRENPDIESHTRLMYRIAQNLIIEFRRARGRRHAAQHVCLDDAGMLPAPLVPVEEVVEMRSMLVAVLARGLPGLPTTCRQALN